MDQVQEEVEEEEEAGESHRIRGRWRKKVTALFDSVFIFYYSHDEKKG